MSAWRRLFRRRPYALVLAAGLLSLLGGDRAQLAPPPGTGIDPFEVLDQQVRNNVLIVLDTSGSMKWPSDRNDFSLGGDDPASRLFQAKAAIRAVVQANRDRVNFGLVSYNALSTDKTLVRNGQNNATGQDFEGDGRTDGPFVYVSADGTAANFYTTHSATDDPTTPNPPDNETCNAVDGFFCRISNVFANYDGTNSADVWRSFMNRDGSAQPADNLSTSYDDPYPAGCSTTGGVLSPVDLSNAAGMRCRFYMQSRLIRNGVRFTWNRGTTTLSARLIGTSTITCPPPPAGLLGHTFTPPCFQMQDGNSGPVSTFYYTSTLYSLRPNVDACGGGALITEVAECNANNAPLVLAKMDPELPVTPTGTLTGVPNPPGNATFDYGDGHLDPFTQTLPNPPTSDGDQVLPDFGLRADQSTPLAASLCGIGGLEDDPTLPGCTDAQAMAEPFPTGPVITGQKNFVILVTDGDDTCVPNATDDQSAVRAAEVAERLYAAFNPNTGAGNFRRWAETFVVGFASAVSPARVNVIAQAGSGRNINNGAATPAAALLNAPCAPGATCRDAFFASNTQQLIDILNAALEQASQTGIFSATASVFDGVPEYVNTVPPPPSPSPAAPLSVLNPDDRYKVQPFRSYRALFSAGTFNGIVRGFDSFGAMTGPAPRPPLPSPVPSPDPGPPPVYPRNWEAGQRLIDPDRMSSDLNPDPNCATCDHTFGGAGGLMENGTPPVPAGTTHIHRRIFTTRQNGRRLGSADDMVGSTFCAGGPCRVNLWPPDPAVVPGQPTNPNDYTTPGILDAQLFLKDDGTQMTVNDLMAAPLRACQPATDPNLPAGCASLTPAVKLAAARKEAREMIIAYTAGAEPRRVGGDPVRNANRHIVYRRRAWVLAETTLATPALVTQPISIVPNVHTQEYLLYRDGPRDLPSGVASGGGSDTFLLQGFGLRNPDLDGQEVPVGTQSRLNLKPVMSVLYVPSNDMLHAFRAGPCPSSAAPCGTVGPLGETGGEELWAFVPHDLLYKLKDRMKAQTRTDHTFMMGASLRFGDVFQPGAFTLSVTGRTYNLAGRWRRVLMFGRGIGGKYYSALDITGTGSMTRAALGTQLPAVLWNRGNPDTQNGLAGGTRVGTNQEFNQYLQMGQTWSTPVYAHVNASQNGGREYVAYVGSGYSSLGPGRPTPTSPVNPDEGTRFYTLDPFSGDIVASVDVGDGLQGGFDNAVVANPVIFSASRLVAGVALPHPAQPINEFVYFGDIHGRLWRIDSRDPATALQFRDLGADQPVGVGAALLNLGGRPNVFVETGRDARVRVPAGGFRMFGFEDAGPPYPAGTVPLPVPSPDFGLAFPPPPAGKGEYRGTLQPVTAFQAGGRGAVFFTGTRFNPITTGRCVSSFDTIIFGLFADDGGTAYATQEYEGVKAVGVPAPPLPPAPGDPPPVDQGTGDSGQEPEPCKDCPPPPKPNTPASVKTATVRPGSSVCR